MQIKENSKEYDVIIVGSGAGGGMATKVLSEAGLSVAVVEAAPRFFLGGWGSRGAPPKIKGVATPARRTGPRARSWGRRSPTDFSR